MLLSVTPAPGSLLSVADLSPSGVTRILEQTSALEAMPATARADRSA